MSASLAPTAVRQRTRPAVSAATDAIGAVRPAGDTTKIRGTNKFEAIDPEHVRVLKEYTATQQLVDPFRDDYGVYEGGGGANLSIVEPPYNFYSLLRLPFESSMLMQCIAAYVTNIDGHGYRLEYVGPKGGETSRDALSEKETLENLLDYPNDEYSMQILRDRYRFDQETFGNSYLEIGRDAQKRVTMFSHVPGHTVRVTRRDAELTPCKVMLPRDGKMEEVQTQKRFRRFVQRVGTSLVYFKEYGDPRIIDPKTGKENTALSFAESATELIQQTQYNPLGPYGLPRWLNQLPSVLGSRQAELTNLDFFKDNAIPAMALMVSGGMVTQSTLTDIEDMFYQARGRTAMHRLLVIEASGDDSQANSEGIIPVPKITLQPLQGDRQQDALFLKYDEACSDKVRSSFRLSKLFVGLTDNFNYATAKTAYEVTESQVFAPERNHFDDIVNKKIIGSYNPKYWAFRSNPPRLTDATEVLNALKAFEASGAITPNVAIGIANEMFDLEIAHIDEVWGDYPMAIISNAARSGVVGTVITSMAVPEGNAVPPEILVMESKNPAALQASGLDGGLLPVTQVTGVNPDGTPLDVGNINADDTAGGDVMSDDPATSASPATPKAKPQPKMKPPAAAPAPVASDSSQQGSGALSTTNGTAKPAAPKKKSEGDLITDLLEMRARIKEALPERPKTTPVRVRTRTRF
jgi:PBSX family phage portal protein